MTDQPDRRIQTNAGRCDVCGRTIDMRDAGDELGSAVVEGASDESREKYGHTEQDARDALADGFESVGETGADYELARVIREHGRIHAHRDCLDDTVYTTLDWAPTETEDH